MKDKIKKHEEDGQITQKQEQSGKMVIKTENILIVIAIVIVIVSVVNIILTSAMYMSVLEKDRISKEEAKPANVQVVQIMYSGCNECSGLSYVIDALRQQNVNITEQALDHMLSDEAKSIVSKYGIKKLPALVITGEINKPLLAPFWNKIGADVRRDSIVYETPNPPYYNVLLNKISGNVKITILKDSSCQDCFDIIGFADYLKTAVYSSDTTILEYNSSEGNDFVKQYNISRIPSVILSQEFGIYPIADAWPTVGTA